MTFSDLPPLSYVSMKQDVLFHSNNLCYLCACGVGGTTLNKTSHIIMTLNIITLTITVLGITLDIKIFSIIIFSITTLIIMTLSITAVYKSTITILGVIATLGTTLAISCLGVKPSRFFNVRYFIKYNAQV
jgi:hypothetical protein